MESEIQYLGRRAEEEREKAERAGDPATYRLHVEFAREYERRLLRLMTADATPEPSAQGGVDL